MLNKNYTALVGVYCVLLSGFSIAQTDDQVPTEQRKSKSRLTLEEVVVTAQKRDENQQDVPISIQSYSGEQLEAFGIKDLAQLTQVTPGLNIGTIAGFSLIYLRGVGNDYFSPGGDSSTAIYIDGLYFSLLGGLGRSLGEIERLEVLKGPQGTLFGRNSTAGAINTVLKDPGEELEARVKVSYGSFDALNSKVYVAGPIVGGLKGSFGAIYNLEDSFYTHTDPDHYAQNTKYFNQNDSGGFAQRHDEGARGKLVWDLMDNLTLKATAYKINSQDASSAVLAAYETKPLGAALGVTPRESAYRNNLDAETGSKSNNEVYSFNLTYSNEDITFNSITGKQDMEFFPATDFDGSSQNIVAFGTQIYADNVSQEIQLLSNDGGRFSQLFGRPLNWIVGAYYFVEDTGFNPYNFVIADRLQLVEGIPALPLLNELTGGLLFNSLNDDTKLVFVNKLDIDSLAIFAQSNMDVTDTIKLTLGARIQKEERVSREARAFIVSDVVPGETPITNFPRQTREDTNVSPRVAIDYSGFDNMLFYTSYSRGFKSGTFNSVSIITAPSEIEAEEMTTIEFGMKGDFFDSSLRVNGALFQNQVENGQVFFISLLSGGIANLENAGAYTVQGAEADITWQPNDSWVFKSSLSYLEGEYEDYIGSGYDEDSGLFRNNLNFNGNQTVRTPELSGNIVISYFTYALGGDWEVAADAYYTDAFFFDAQNSLPQESYEVFGARVSYFYEDWNLRLTAIGRNLTGEEYATTRYSSDFASLETMAPPKTWAFEIDWNY